MEEEKISLTFMTEEGDSFLLNVPTTNSIFQLKQ